MLPPQEDKTEKDLDPEEINNATAIPSEEINNKDLTPKPSNSNILNYEEIDKNEKEEDDEEDLNLVRSHSDNKKKDNKDQLHYPEVKPFSRGYVFRNRNQEGTLNYYGPNIIRRYRIKSD